MKEAFREIKLSNKNKNKLYTINLIIEQYANLGYKMTLRQLYYQLVSKAIIPNNKNEYGKLSTLLKEGRMAGYVDWNAIEDRLRVPYIPYSVDNIQDAIEDTISHYRLDRQRGQDTYVEVWVEKDALSGILKRVTRKYHINLLVNRGYGSVTAMHDAYIRYKEQILAGKNIKLLYLGDHDPSGIDMIRDIRTRVGEMLDGYADYFEIENIALTMKQVRQYNPPENPTKLTDPRSKWYVDKFGYHSWEVDALDPQTLHELVTNNIEKNINMDIFNDVLDEEKEDKTELKTILDEF